MLLALHSCKAAAAFAVAVWPQYCTLLTSQHRVASCIPARIRRCHVVAPGPPEPVSEGVSDSLSQRVSSPSESWDSWPLLAGGGGSCRLSAESAVPITGISQLHHNMYVRMYTQHCNLNLHIDHN